MLIRKFAVDFAEKYKSKPIQLSSEARLLLEGYRWPGNIRELKNLVEQLAVLSEKDEISIEELLVIAPHLSDVYKRQAPAPLLVRGPP